MVGFGRQELAQVCRQRGRGAGAAAYVRGDAVGDGGDAVEFEVGEESHAKGGREGVPCPNGVFDLDWRWIAFGEVAVTTEEASIRSTGKRHDPEIETHSQFQYLLPGVP